METKTGSLGDVAQTDSDDDSISRQVIDAVADAKGVDPLDLPPLYDRVDPDALDSFFPADGASAPVASLRFEVAGCEVLVRRRDDVVVVQAESDPDSVEADAETVQYTRREAAEERCGIDVGANGRTDTYYV
jgi:hypothetical protein